MIFPVSVIPAVNCETVLHCPETAGQVELFLSDVSCTDVWNFFLLLSQLAYKIWNITVNPNFLSPWDELSAHISIFIGATNPNVGDLKSTGKGISGIGICLNEYTQRNRGKKRLRFLSVSSFLSAGGEGISSDEEGVTICITNNSVSSSWR